jgi:hypothetical protein
MISIVNALVILKVNDRIFVSCQALLKLMSGLQSIFSVSLVPDGSKYLSVY